MGGTLFLLFLASVSFLRIDSLHQRVEELERRQKSGSGKGNGGSGYVLM